MYTWTTLMSTGRSHLNVLSLLFSLPPSPKSTDPVGHESRGPLRFSLNGDYTHRKEFVEDSPTHFRVVPQNHEWSVRSEVASHLP